MRYTVHRSTTNCYGYVVRDNVKQFDVQWCATEKYAQDLADRMNAALKEDTPINWKPWNGTPVDDTYIANRSALLLEKLQDDNATNRLQYVMSGDTLIIGFRDTNDFVELYRCKILERATFVQKPVLTWVNEE